jgi:Tol biopolymer transport system component
LAKRTLRIISADGKEIRDLATFEDVQMVPSWTTWTPDGKYVMFLKPNPQEIGMIQLWRIPVQGGDTEKLNLEMWAFYNLTVHPDGTRLAFGSYGPSLKQAELWMMENFLPDRGSQK